MCFSAEASFVGAAVVAGGGVAALTQVRRPRQLLYGALPIGFAIHQFLEGMTWVQLDGQADVALSGWAVHLWVVFAWALLPLWLPVAVLLIEPDPGRRRRMMPLVAIGAALFAYMMVGAAQPEIEVRVVDSSLDYVLPFGHGVLLAIPYILTTCVAPILSSHRWVQIFGAANLVALSAAAAIKAAAFSSIWCTFAAFLSILIFVHLRQQRREDTERSEALV